MRYRILAWLVIFELGLFWLMYGGVAVYRLQFASPTRPPLLVGRQLDLSTSTSLISDPREDSRNHDGIARYLLLVSSDTCQFSRGAAARWQELVERLAFGQRDEVWLVTLDGVENFVGTLRILKRRGVRYEIRRPSDSRRLAIHTGIDSTPQTIVMDSSRRIHAVTGRLTDRGIDLVANDFETITLSERAGFEQKGDSK